ncbi:MAG TPA: GNAT family N-acetyltransferase [Acidimicrobiales bacterium]|nr:GNAT family N-acetyltransferase [Acidimicrobiales bacterium]
MTRSFHGSIRPVRQEDADVLRSILEHWLGADAEQALSRVLADDSEIHVVADEGGRVVGVMGVEFDGIRPPLFGPDDTPASLVSAYVHPHHRGRGVGTALADHLETVAIERGCTRLVVVSGARSREVAYGFWRSRYGTMAFYDSDAFGPGLECVAWTVPLGRHVG